MLATAETEASTQQRIHLTVLALHWPVATHSLEPTSITRADFELRYEVCRKAAIGSTRVARRAGT